MDGVTCHQPEVSSKGRNVIRINGQLTTITALAKIGEYLVDIHGQNDQQMLMDQSRQIDLLDEYAGKDFKPLLGKYQAEYQTWQKPLTSAWSTCAGTAGNWPASGHPPVPGRRVDPSGFDG